MAKAKVYADFHNADRLGRLRLNTAGTLADLARQQVELREGLLLALYSDDANDQGEPDELRADGWATYSEEERCWVAAINWNEVRHQSDIAREKPDGRDTGTGATLNEEQLASQRTLNH